MVYNIPMVKEYISNDGALVIEVDASEEAVTLKWIGRSADLQPAKFILPIFEEHILNNEKSIVLDFVHLEYFNSPTLAPIIQVLNLAKEGSKKIKIIYNSEYEWQLKTFSAFKVFEKPDQIFISGND